MTRRASSARRVEAHEDGYSRPHLRLVEAPAAAPRERVAVRLSFSELALIHKSLQAVKTLGAVPHQDELLNDTMQIVDVTMNAFVKWTRPARRWDSGLLQGRSSA
jgi:predicted nucleic acid-binding protein